MLLATWSCAVWAADPAQNGAVTGPQAVETIVVTGRKLNVESKIDRKVYSVTDDLQTTFGNASDILGLIPSVDVDPDGVISLRGDTNVLVLIDGKPSTLFQGSAAGENLQSLSAADIERIEVLTTPPPQYKAEGTAGVINIITRKGRSRGASGTAQGSLGDGGRSVVATNMGYAAAQSSVALNAGFREDYRQRQVASTIIGPDPVSGQVLDSRSGFSERLRRQTPNVGLTGEYSLDDRRELSGSASWMRRGGLRTYTQLNESADPAGTVTSSTGRLSSGHDPENDYDTALRYSQKLAREGETLDLSLHRSISHQHEHYDYTNQSFVPPAPDFYSNLGFTEDHGITEADADYVLPLTKTRTLKLGYAFEQDDYGFNNVGQRADPATGALAVDPSLTNEFRYQQRIQAAYGSYQAVVGEWTWLGGLRAEWTATDALQVTNAQATADRYFELFPSLHVDHPLSDRTTLSFGASRRITRPDPSAMNPYVDHEYTPNLNAGNPNLRPQITQSVDLGVEYDRRGSTYTATAYYRRNRDSVTDVIDYLGGGYSLDTKANLPRNDSAGLEFQATGEITAMLSYSVSGNAFYSQIDAAQLGTPGLRSTTGVNLKTKLDFQPTRRDSAQVTFTRTDNRLTPQGMIGAINLVNLGCKRTLTAKLSLVATVTDVFNGQRFVRTTVTPDLFQLYQRSVEGRVTYVGLVYSFGEGKKDQQPRFDYDTGG